MARKKQKLQKVKTQEVAPKAPAAPVAEAAPAVTGGQIVERIRSILDEAKALGIVISVADSSGTIKTWAAARSYGELSLLGHFAQKEVDRLLGQTIAQAAKK
jgi:hypothetical protein